MHMNAILNSFLMSKHHYTKDIVSIMQGIASPCLNTTYYLIRISMFISYQAFPDQNMGNHHFHCIADHTAQH